jgi:hypothetical protein
LQSTQHRDRLAAPTKTARLKKVVAAFMKQWWKELRQPIDTLIKRTEHILHNAMHKTQKRESSNWEINPGVFFSVLAIFGLWPMVIYGLYHLVLSAQ